MYLLAISVDESSSAFVVDHKMDVATKSTIMQFILSNLPTGHSPGRLAKWEIWKFSGRQTHVDHDSYVSVF